MNGRDHDILEFERLWWQQAGSKEAEIRERFGLSPVRYYQRLARILDDPAALEVDPILVRRLRRIRSSRAAARASTRGDTY